MSKRSGQVSAQGNLRAKQERMHLCVKTYLRPGGARGTGTNYPYSRGRNPGRTVISTEISNNTEPAVGIRCQSGVPAIQIRAAGGQCFGCAGVGISAEQFKSRSVLRDCEKTSEKQQREAQRLAHVSDLLMLP